jgi:hypothetical protein
MKSKDIGKNDIPLSVLEAHDARMKGIPINPDRILNIQDCVVTFVPRLERKKDSKFNQRVSEIIRNFKPRGDGITRCYWCGKRLTVSAKYGVGPDCMKNRGPMPGRGC